ncbi:hypothetical protein E2C01_011574 [Portunus trituberculatus]|uniref:Uncharacterized protein n=1 Tax=Portunus trituberculatus TaxID=210409 RepID=A0A5B7DBI9_PORTR|nr:hypothetical protein [Portunus trituberculatus]
MPRVQVQNILPTLPGEGQLASVPYRKVRTEQDTKSTSTTNSADKNTQTPQLSELVDSQH